MAEFPEVIDTFRDVQNRPGVVYDPTKLTTVFADDIGKLGRAIVTLENLFGTDFPQEFETLMDFYQYILSSFVTTQEIGEYGSTNMQTIFTGGTTDGIQYNFTTPVVRIGTMLWWRLWAGMRVTGAGVTNIRLTWSGPADTYWTLSPFRAIVTIKNDIAYGNSFTSHFSVNRNSSTGKLYCDIPFSMLTKVGFPSTGNLSFYLDFMAGRY